MPEMDIRSNPCTACPYRRDVASGVWHHDEYEKLRLYDADTMEQPFAPFACHATPEHLCNGWANVHSSRGHRYDLIALRLLRIGIDDIPESTVPLWSSGNEAADHGQADIDNPGPTAVATVDRLTRKYPRLQTEGTAE